MRGGQKKITQEKNKACRRGRVASDRRPSVPGSWYVPHRSALCVFLFFVTVCRVPLVHNWRGRRISNGRTPRAGSGARHGGSRSSREPASLLPSRSRGCSRVLRVCSPQNEPCTSNSEARPSRRRQRWSVVARSGLTGSARGTRITGHRDRPMNF